MNSMPEEKKEVSEEESTIFTSSPTRERKAPTDGKKKRK